jgi:hypothetical protein
MGAEAAQAVQAAEAAEAAKAKAVGKEAAEDALGKGVAKEYPCCHDDGSNEQQPDINIIRTYLANQVNFCHGDVNDSKLNSRRVQTILKLMLEEDPAHQQKQERPELARIKAEISIATFEIIKTKENKKACAAELQRWDTATAGSVHHHAAYDALVARKSDLARAQEFLAAAKRREAQAQALQDSLSADESGTAAQFQLTSAAAHFRAARVQAEEAVAAAEGLFQKAKAFAAKAGVDEIIAETSSTARALLVAKAKASEAGAIAAMVAGSLAMQMGRDALLEVRVTADVIESRLETMQTAILMP